MSKHTGALGTMPIPRLLLQTSLPATVGMMVNALYNVVDTIFVGRGVGPDAIGGLAIAFPLQIMLMGIAQMIGIGAAALISIRLGEKDQEGADLAAGNGLSLTLLLSGLFVLTGFFFLTPLLRFFGASDTLFSYAYTYMRIILTGNVFFALTMCLSAMVRAEGNATLAMKAMIMGTVLNMLLTPLFIYRFHLGVAGSAYATILSQFISFLYLIYYLFNKESTLKIKARHFLMKPLLCQHIMQLGLPAFLRQMSGSFVTIILNRSLVFYGGDVAVTVFGILNKITLFIFMPMFGVSQGMQPIVGYNYGARSYPRIAQALKLSLIVTTILATLGTLICMLFPVQLTAFFTTDPAVLKMTPGILRQINVAVPLIGVQIISATLFQALGRALPANVLSMLRQVLLFIPLALILPTLYNLKLQGIVLAFPIADILAILISALLLRHEMRRLRNEMASASDHPSAA